MTDITFRSDVEVELVEVSASDLRVAKAAWVSTKGERAEDEADTDRLSGLIGFLMRDRHGSPFEHSSFTFAIRCPIFVVREFHRHRAGWSYNEESGRYTQLKPEFYIPARERNLTQTGKPGQYVFSPGTDDQYAWVAQGHKAVSRTAYENYERLLRIGVAKEVARMTLPLNIYTSFYATCNARSLMHFLSLRTENENATYPSHPQKEIQMVADKMEILFDKHMPITRYAWEKNGRVAP
jgi:thymidylate synthase (FAD)